jgi:predicted restriction endonuclease
MNLHTLRPSKKAHTIQDRGWRVHPAEPLIQAVTEAAHGRWWAAHGPDEVTNALALCSLHHELFHRQP